MFDVVWLRLSGNLKRFYSKINFPMVKFNILQVLLCYTQEYGLGCDVTSSKRVEFILSNQGSIYSFNFIPLPLASNIW